LSCSDTEAQPGTAGHWDTVFETDEKDLAQTLAKEKAAEIAADFMTVFYHIQVGALQGGRKSSETKRVLSLLLSGVLTT
jgi:hypothetical protein